MPPSDPTDLSRNHTARIGRLIEAVDEIFRRQMELQETIAGMYEYASPMIRVQQLLAEYELKTGEGIDPLIREALDHISSHYDGFLDLVKTFAPPLRCATIIAEERVRWQTTKKRNEYMMHAQRRRRAKVFGQQEVFADDIREYERQTQHSQPIGSVQETKPWTDEEMARGEHLVRRSDKVWLGAVKRDEEREHRTDESTTDEVEEVDEGRLQYERERAERQRQEAELLANRGGSPLVGSIKP